MKTNQSLIRQMGPYDVIQRTSDGYFDANALLQQWNNTPKNSQRKMSEFMESPGTRAFIESLKDELVAIGEISPEADFQAIKATKGRMTRNGRTKDQVWMYPYLFIKFAMWLNARFEVKVIRYVYDQLVQYRHEAGDAYREMSSAIQKIVKKSEMTAAIQHVAKAINHIVFGGHESEMRNKRAEENSMRELFELERKIASLINEGFISSYDNLMRYLRRLWNDKYRPACLAPIKTSVATPTNAYR